jgi:uncharacterized protein
MRRNLGRNLAIAAILVLALLIFGRSAAIFYTDLLWYDAVGQASVFWRRLVAAAAVRVTMGAIGAALILLNLWYVLRQLGPVHLRRRYGNLEIAEQVPRSYLVGGALAVSVLAGWWLATLQFGGNAPIAVLAWLQRENWGVTDPLFGHDVSFYVFSLPLYMRVLEYLLIILVWSVLLVGIGYVLVGAVRLRGSSLEIDDRPRMHFAVLLAAVLVVFGVRYLLARYQLMLDGNGFGGSIGYTDVHARLPAHVVLSVLSFVTAAALIYGARQRSWVPPAAAAGVFVIAVLGMGVAYPALLQNIRVEPNQLAHEARFIRWNMEFTRRAYGLDLIERRSFPYQRATGSDWAAMAPVLDEVPLWDPGPLQTAFNEVQSRFDYYHFPDVDFDRYGPEGQRRQVAVSVREFRREGVPQTARTWTNYHLNPIFTRGMGLVAVPSAETRRGDPAWWLADVFPVQRSPDAPPELELTEPSIYFGETMTLYAVVGHTGSFAGTGAEVQGRVPPAPRVDTGIELSSFLRVLSFAWRFGDQNLIFARELTDTSRLIFRRRITERLQAVAPFLLWDPDPHPVVADGRVVWVVDGYSASGSYPLSRPFLIEDMGALSYMRSSVKATVDAVTGNVNLYALPQPDPILTTYRRVFPGLVQDWEQMPERIRAHLRYPALLFRVQSNVLEQYHLEQPEAFYAGQDVWQLPQDVAPQTRARFRPDFIMAPMPGTTTPEFLLLNAFIARGRQNMTALLMARSDAPHYGELVLLQMPRDDQIRGPSQVQSVIEQDPVIAQQLSLWRQQGSNVQLGRLRYLPTANSILYVEPLFLSAAERGIPQLQRVIVSDGIAVAMAADLRSAITALVGDVPGFATDDQQDPADAAELADRPAREPVDAVPGEEWRRRAAELLREAEDRLRAGDFAGFGAAWNRLRALLEQGGATAPIP